MSAHGSSDAFDKYRRAGKLAEDSYKYALSLVANGATLAEICEAGDAYINERSNGQISGGVCHPMTAQLDNIVCNHAPKAGNPTSVGSSSLIKLQVGAHVDGYGAVVGGNLLLPDAPESSAELCREVVRTAQLALDYIKPGTTNSELVEMLKKHLDGTGYQGVPGLLAHSHSQFDIQGPKKIDLFPTETAEAGSGIAFEEGEVYTMEVWLTNASNPVPIPDGNLDSTLNQIPPSVQPATLGPEVSSAYSQVTKQVGTFPFHTRALQDADTARQVLSEAGVLASYPPFTLKETDKIVAQCVVSFVVHTEGAHVFSPAMLE